MKWKRKTPKWKRWYAWRPVKTGDGVWEWLTYVWTRRFMGSDGYLCPWWGYKPDGAQPQEDDWGSW